MTKEELIKELELLTDSCGRNDALDLVKKYFDSTYVVPPLQNGRRVLAALKELSDCFTDEELKTMFCNDIKL